MKSEINNFVFVYILYIFIHVMHYKKHEIVLKLKNKL